MTTRKNKRNRKKPAHRGRTKYRPKSPKPQTNRNPVGQSKKHTKPVRQPTTGLRLWLFRAVAAIIFPLIFLAAIELTLRLVGFGFPASAIQTFKSDGTKKYCENAKFAWQFFPPNIAREFEPFIFDAAKKTDTYRIFIAGASAAQGVPDSAYSFARILNVMLRKRYPQVNFEVINTTMTAINSHVVLPIVKDCAKHDPDLFIVYLGNNEVVGPYGAADVFGGFSTNLSLVRFGIAARTTRTGQMLAGLTGIAEDPDEVIMSWGGMEMFLDRQLRASDRRLETVYSHFRRNLEDIRDAALDANAQIILCTVGSNLKDCPPFASLHRADLNETRKSEWNRIYQQGIDLETRGDFTNAIESFLAASAIDDTYAELHAMRTPDNSPKPKPPVQKLEKWMHFASVPTTESMK